MMQFLFSNTPLAYFVASFWRDEAFSYLMARQPIHQLLWNTAADANPPLYYIVLKLWMGIFGSSEVAIRSLSLVFFWAALYVAFLIMRDIFKYSPKKACFYLLLFVGNPILHYYAFEARMYSMMAFIGTLLFYALMKKEYKLYAYAALAALFTHYFLLGVIAFQVVFILITTHKKERGHFLYPLFKGLVWYIPWIIILIFARPPVGQSFWISPSTLQNLSLVPAIIMTGYEKAAGVAYPYLFHLSLLLCGIIIYGYHLHKSHRIQQTFLLLLGWALGIPLAIYLFSFWKPVFLPRYLIFSSVGLLLLLIVCIESIKNRFVRTALFILIFSFSITYAFIQVKTRTKAPLRKIFHSMRNEMKVNDVLYVTHEYDFHAGQYYLPTHAVYLYKKTYEELPWFVGKVLIDKNAFRDSLPRYPERAFIMNNDGTYSVQSID